MSLPDDGPQKLLGCPKLFSICDIFEAQLGEPFLEILVAPVLRDTAETLSAITRLLRAMGFFGVSTWPMGCDTPSPVSERLPSLRTCEVEVRYPPPPSKGVSQRYLRDTP